MKTKHKLLAATAAAGLVLTVFFPAPAPVLGHGGEDHGAAAQPSTGVALTDEVLLPKESQFLFAVRTNLASYSTTYSRATLYGTVAAAAESMVIWWAPKSQGRVGRVAAVRAPTRIRRRAGGFRAGQPATAWLPEFR